MKQGSPQEVLVLTMRPPHLVSTELPRHLGNCRMVIRETNLALCDTATLRAIADDLPNRPHTVVDDCLQATMLQLMTPMAHRSKLVLLTDDHPVMRPLPAVNLETRTSNFN